jgi:hypothetical protein
MLTHNFLLFHEIFAPGNLMSSTDFHHLNIYFLSRLLVARHGRRLVDATLVLDALQLGLLSVSSQKSLIVLHLKLLV